MGHSSRAFRGRRVNPAFASIHAEDVRGHCPAGLHVASHPGVVPEPHCADCASPMKFETDVIPAKAGFRY